MNLNDSSDSMTVLLAPPSGPDFFFFNYVELNSFLVLVAESKLLCFINHISNMPSDIKVSGLNKVNK